MPVRLVSVPTDWENEIAAWFASDEGDGTSSWHPTQANHVQNLGGSSTGGDDGAIAANKTFKIYRKTMKGTYEYEVSGYGRLYNVTKATTISSYTCYHSGSGEYHYDTTSGNPLTNYAYDANDVVYLQIKGTGVTHPRNLKCLFEAQIVDR